MSTLATPDYTKTVYDPNIWSADKMKEMGYRGFKNAIDNNNFSTSDRSFEGSVDGITVKGHYNDDGNQKTIATWWLE